VLVVHHVGERKAGPQFAVTVLHSNQCEPMVVAEAVEVARIERGSDGAGSGWIGLNWRADDPVGPGGWRASAKVGAGFVEVDAGVAFIAADRITRGPSQSRSAFPVERSTFALVSDASDSMFLDTSINQTAPAASPAMMVVAVAVTAV
jgi:hypothetical protein